MKRDYFVDNTKYHREVEGSIRLAAKGLSPILPWDGLEKRAAANFKRYQKLEKVCRPPLFPLIVTDKEIIKWWYAVRKMLRKAAEPRRSAIQKILYA